MKRKTWRAVRTVGLRVAFFVCVGARAGGQSIAAPAYAPVAPYGPKTVVPGYTTYVYVSWKQTARTSGNSAHKLAVVSAPRGWVTTFPDLEPSKGRSDQPGALLAIAPPRERDTGSDDRGPQEIVVEMKGAGEAIRQTVSLNMQERYPTTRKFAPLGHNPRLFWDNLKTYEDNFARNGAKYGSKDYCTKVGIWEGGSWYYDGGRVFFQWADYSRNRGWSRYAANPLETYRKYVLENRGGIPGWRVFTEGLKQDFLRNGREESKEAALAVARNAAYHPVSTPMFYLRDAGKIRELSYAVDSYLDAIELGDPEHPRLNPYVDLLIGYVQVMCVDQSERYAQPFMLALCSEALIKYYERTKDSRIPGTIVAIANFCMNKAWVPSDQSWWYESYPEGKTPADVPRPHPGAPDLNLLVLPLFAWLHQQTGDVAYLDVCDHAFAAGVNKAFLDNGKQFSQNYRWSLNYVIARKTIKDRGRTLPVPLQRSLRRS